MWIFFYILINLNSPLFGLLHAIVSLIENEKNSETNQHIATASSSKSFVPCDQQKDKGKCLPCTKLQKSKRRISHSKKATKISTQKKKKKSLRKCFHKHGSSPEPQDTFVESLLRESYTILTRNEKARQRREKTQLDLQRRKQSSLKQEQILASTVAEESTTATNLIQSLLKEEEILASFIAEESTTPTNIITTSSEHLELSGVKENRVLSNIYTFLNQRFQIYEESTYTAQYRYAVIFTSGCEFMSRRIEAHLKKVGFCPDRSYVWLLPHDVIRADLDVWREDNVSPRCDDDDVDEIDETVNVLLVYRTLNNVLDLHLLTVERAMQVFELFYLQQKMENSQTIYVNTGRGLHSEDGIPRIKPAVDEYLKLQGIRWALGNPYRHEWDVHGGYVEINLD